jgi:hypothetical protein
MPNPGRSSSQTMTSSLPAGRQAGDLALREFHEWPSGSRGGQLGIIWDRKIIRLVQSGSHNAQVK